MVDRNAKARLTADLQALLQGSSVIGEEQCAATPQLLERIDHGRAQLLDDIKHQLVQTAADVAFQPGSQCCGR